MQLRKILISMCQSLGKLNPTLKITLLVIYRWGSPKTSFAGASSLLHTGNTLNIPNVNTVVLGIYPSLHLKDNNRSQDR